MDSGLRRNDGLEGQKAQVANLRYRAVTPANAGVQGWRKEVTRRDAISCKPVPNRRMDSRFRGNDGSWERRV